MKILAIIPARSGSKGIKNKNIIDLDGKPLIYWTISAALKSKSIDRVIVSTDCNQIAKVAKEFGAEVPFLRPKEISKDNSPEWKAWRHALSFLQKTEGKMPEIMLSIPTTSPLRRVVDIENCIKLYKKGDADVVITTTEAHRSPFFNMVKEIDRDY